VLDPSCDLLIESIEAAPERGVGLGKLWQYGSESGAENAAIGSCAKPQGSQAGVGNSIAVGLGNAFDDAMQAKTAQVIGHLPWGQSVGWLPEQRCEVWAQVTVGKACGEQLEQEKGAPESLHSGIGKTESRGALRCHPDGAIDGLKSFFGEDAIVTDALHVEQSSVGLKADAS